MALTKAFPRMMEGVPVSVKDFGAVGDGVTDDTASIQAALDASTYVVFPPGTYLIDGNTPGGVFGRHGIEPQSGSYLKFNKATLQVKPTAEVGYNAIYVTGSDITIDGATIVGERDEHLGSTGEFGMGIETRSVDRVKIINCHISDCWGDGIYIGRDSTNIFIENTICDGNRRQGMSVIDVNGMFVSNCKFINTSGTAPQAGIDFEPNSSVEFLRNIHLVNIECSDNAGNGILVYAQNLDDAEMSINVTNYTSKNCNVGIYLQETPTGDSYGSINFTNVTIQESDSGGIRLKDWLADGVKANFKNVTIIDPNTQDEGGVSQGGVAFSYLFDDLAGVAGDYGGFSIDGFSVRRTGRVTTFENNFDITLPIYVIADGQEAKDIELSNIDCDIGRIYGLGRLNLVHNKVDFEFDADIGSVTVYPGGPPGTRTIGLSNGGFANAYIDQVAVGKNVAITLRDPTGFTGIYPPVTVALTTATNTYSTSITIDGSTLIHPNEDATLATSSGSRFIGTRAKLQVIDEAWHIIEQEGTWV